MSEHSSPASAFAAALLAALAREGLTDVVVCPGARSQALALAAWQLEQRGDLTVHVRIDERSAAFFALGLARETGRAAAVITTSGTAVANLMPAVLEAHHASVPMLLLTADRPEELRGIRSNQTTVQAGIFEPFVRFAADISAPEPHQNHVETALTLAAEAWQAATGGYPGPAHLNIAFRAPLSDAQDDIEGAVTAVEQQRQARVAGARPSTHTDGRAYLPVETLHTFIETVVIAGSGAGAEAEAFAHQAQMPLLAEVASGARFGREAITNYRALLAADAWGGRVRRVIVFGVPTLTREVPALIDQDGVETIVVTAHPSAELYNPGH